MENLKQLSEGEKGYLLITLLNSGNYDRSIFVALLNSSTLQIFEDKTQYVFVEKQTVFKINK